MEICGFTNIKSQYKYTGKIHPEAISHAAQHSMQLIIPGIPNIKKQGAIDGLETQAHEWKFYSKVFNERKPDLI